MWQQVLAIAWVQFRITRNHLPRTNTGSVLMWLLSCLWYAVFAWLAVLLAIFIPEAQPANLNQWLPIGLLGLFLYSQTIPLLTLSAGWSLQINKLQVYPIPDRALFGMEVLLRITGAPEVIVLLVGGVIGLARRPDISFLGPYCLLLFLPLLLFLQLAVRDFVTYAFERNRFREILTILFVSVGVLPQLLVRTKLGGILKPYFFLAAQGLFTPWHEVSSLSLGRFSLVDLLLLVFWTLVAYLLARRQFNRSLVRDDAFQAATLVLGTRGLNTGRLIERFSNLFKDPLAALLQKEFQSLTRMPRFRVVLGMACIFSILVFLPILLGESQTHVGFMARNYFSVVNLYGLLILADSLLLNIFGTDRAAAQLYFVSPVPLETVVKAKNIVACTFIALQNLIVAVLTPFFVHVSPLSVVSGIGASAVSALFLLCTGNLLSVAMPRPIDPTSTFKKQAGARMQLWMLLCSVGMASLVGFAYLARYAFNRDWVLPAILLLELIIGVIVYRIALESAVKRGHREREKIIDALSKGASPISSTLGLS